MSEISKNKLDPFRSIISFYVESSDSDKLTYIISRTGLQFDQNLTGEQSYSHKTRVRAYQPKILAAYELLEDQEKLMVSNAIIGILHEKPEPYLERILDNLKRIGWEVNDNKLAVATPDLREMFFPKGSQWDAFVVLRNLFSEAKTELMIVDSYCDEKIFQMLPNEGITKIKILCWQYAEKIAIESRVFASQHMGISIEVKKTKDYHDRFVVIDGKSFVHVGASIKDAGKTAFMISRVENETNIATLLANIIKTWDEANAVT